MGIVAHIHDLHLANLVNDAAIVALVEQRWHVEDGVEHLDKHIASTHQPNQSFGVVEHRPIVVPCVALGESIAPLKRAEWRLERTVVIAAAHEFCLIVEHMAVVERMFAEGLQLVLALTQFLSQLIDTPIVVGILQGACHALVDAHIVGHISQSVVVLEAQSAGRRHLWMHMIGTIDDSLPQCLYVVAGQADGIVFQISISHHRGRVIAHHAPTMAWACPLGQEPAFFVAVHQSLLHLLVHLGIEQVEQREQTAEGVPKAGVGEIIAWADFSGVRTVVNGIPFGIDFVERTGEEHRAVETTVERAQVVGVGVFHLNASQHLVPSVASLLADVVEIEATTQFEQVLTCLLLANER